LQVEHVDGELTADQHAQTLAAYPPDVVVMKFRLRDRPMNARVKTSMICPSASTAWHPDRVVLEEPAMPSAMVVLPEPGGP
jgi:hypothetical protein